MTKTKKFEFETHNMADNSPLQKIYDSEMYKCN